MTEAWVAQDERQKSIERIARAIMNAERKSTRPDDVLVFFDPFRWDGELSTPRGAYVPDDITNKRPAWTAPRIIRMAVAALEQMERVSHGNR